MIRLFFAAVAAVDHPSAAIPQTKASIPKYLRRFIVNPQIATEMAI
jgi:hypothetical protein